jgi:hypothetical protein
LFDPITVTGILTFGAAAGALITHARENQRHGEDCNVPKSVSDTAHAITKAPLRMKALVVSRDPEMIGTFSALFHERNVETRECFLGSVAIDQLSSNKFEFVVLDFDQVPGCADIVRRLPRPDKYVVIAVNTDRRALIWDLPSYHH